MTVSREAVREVIDALLAGTSKGDAIALDDVGAAVGAKAFAPDDIEAVIVALEREGRHVVSPEATGKLHLPRVLAAARAIQQETGKRATVDGIAARTGLSAEAVRQALDLGRIMGR
jgi:hypothetical protein